MKVYCEKCEYLDDTFFIPSCTFILEVKLVDTPLRKESRTIRLDLDTANADNACEYYLEKQKKPNFWMRLLGA